VKKEVIIKKLAKEVKNKLNNECSGHDWWHVYRVWNLAKQIGRKEKADMYIVELTALLHDIADWKFYDGDETIGPKLARKILTSHNVPRNIIDHVCEIIATMSFKGADVKTKMKTLEGCVVQDADRLDAIGAIGIARAFAYGGHKGRTIYDPQRKPTLHKTKDAYFKNEGPTLNHFYEKLLLLKDRMNTKTAKELAIKRHKFMEKYLENFLEEWQEKLINNLSIS